jgi:uncharacterized protein YqgC (DUF456 family)
MSFLPVPGILYMLAVAIGFAYADGFIHVSSFDLGILAGLTILTLLIDLVSGIVGARWGGASWMSVFAGLAGLILGSIFIPIPILGGIIGMFLGTLTSEILRTGDMKEAHDAALGSFLGWLAGTGFKALTAIVFIILFVLLSLG